MRVGGGGGGAGGWAVTVLLLGEIRKKYERQLSFIYLDLWLLTDRNVLLLYHVMISTIFVDILTVL